MTTIPKKLRSPRVVLLAMSLATLTTAARGADIYLVAGTTTKLMPDGASIPMWGFALDPDFGGDGVVTIPGPTIEVLPGDATLSIHLKNNLAEPVSIVIPGLRAAMSPVYFTDGQGRPRVRSFTHEAAPGGSATYTWTNLQPGTRLYQSGTHSSVQVQMGLYGCITQDASPGEAYPGVAYDQQVLLVFSEIDPALHDAVDSGNYVSFGDPQVNMTSTIDFRPKYFLVNGEPYSAGTPSITAGNVGDDVLVRLVNAGLRSYAPVMLGAHVELAAEDGYSYTHRTRQYSILLPAAKTLDVLFTPSAAGMYPLFDRRLNLTNAGAAPGGVLRVLSVAP